MKINKIDHICVAVKDLKAACQVWEPLLGKAGPDDPYEHAPEQIRVARYQIGEVGFELMESTSPDGPVAQWIAKHGEGIMLISFNVDHIRMAAAALQSQGYPLIPDHQGDVIRAFRECEFTMVHPRKLNGVLTELIDNRGTR